MKTTHYPQHHLDYHEGLETLVCWECQAPTQPKDLKENPDDPEDRNLYCPHCGEVAGNIVEVNSY